MATIFLILIIGGFVVGTGIYIAIMNHQWWKKNGGDKSSE